MYSVELMKALNISAASNHYFSRPGHPTWYKPVRGAADEMTAIRALRDELTEAIRAKDAERVISMFAPEPVMFVLPPPLRFRGDEGPDREGIRQWFDTFVGPIGYRVQEFEVAAGSEVAFCHGLIHISGERRDGTQTDLWARETLGLRKISGSWRIAHQHQSVPLYMDGSERAAVDLKP
jgi:uncharacterized protein (TIGR02246 family)